MVRWINSGYTICQVAQGYGISYLPSVVVQTDEPPDARFGCGQ